MRNFTKLVIASAMLATQATPTAPNVVAASVQTSVQTVVSPDSKLEFSTNSASAVELKLPQAPNFDTEVLKPLQDAQAKRARELAAAKAETARKAAEAEQARKAALAKTAQATVQVVTAVPFVGGPLSDAAIQFLGNCESGMTANRNSGNGYYGAFQFGIGTWNSMGTGYARADLAPLGVQIDAVQRLLSRSSIYSQFPGCARKMHAASII